MLHRKARIWLPMDFTKYSKQHPLKPAEAEPSFRRSTY